MGTNAELIKNFYAAFNRHDYAPMVAAYDPAAEFADEVFEVKGKRVGAMWHMLVGGGSDVRVVSSNIQADDTQGSAHWEATYTFSATKRPVHNIIDSEFRFRDGKIIWQHDHFDFWRWSRMALGPTGIFLGWSPMVHNKVRATASANLDKFIARVHPEYQTP